jgi:uncharacterized protein
MKKLLFLIICFGIVTCNFQHKYNLPVAALTNDEELNNTVSILSKQLIASYEEGNRKSYLDNLFRLQILAGEYTGAMRSIDSLRIISKQTDPHFADLLYIQYELYSKARLKQDISRQSFNNSFTELFNELF